MEWIPVAIAVTAVVAAVLIISYITYRIAFYVSPRHKEDIYALPGSAQYEKCMKKTDELIREMNEIPWERVYITAKDGTKLAGRYHHVADDAPLQIQFHGYRGAALRDFCGGNKLARQMGHNTLVVDQRAHGESGRRTITFGIKECYDCLCWVEYAVKRFGEDTPIYLAGVSMGAATVLMASELPLPKNVKGIIADSPYSSPEAILKRECKARGFAPALAFPFLQFGALVFGGFKIKDGAPMYAVKHAKVPILLIHGEDDLFVPCEMSREIYEACAGEKMLKTFPKAGHGLSYIEDEEGYAAAVNEFLEKCEKA